MANWQYTNVQNIGNGVTIRTIELVPSVEDIRHEYESKANKVRTEPKQKTEIEDDGLEGA